MVFGFRGLWCKEDRYIFRQYFVGYYVSVVNDFGWFIVRELVEEIWFRLGY